MNNADQQSEGSSDISSLEEERYHPSSLFSASSRDPSEDAASQPHASFTHLVRGSRSGPPGLRSLPLHSTAHNGNDISRTTRSSPAPQTLRPVIDGDEDEPEEDIEIDHDLPPLLPTIVSGSTLR